jgi:hypothetical protein
MANWKIDEVVEPLPKKPTPPVMIDMEYALPGTFVVRARRGDVRAEIEVEVRDRHAWAMRVSVTTGSKRGVTAAMLREIPIRELMAKGALRFLQTVEATPDGWKARPVPRPDKSESARAAVADAVGYIEVETWWGRKGDQR